MSEIIVKKIINSKSDSFEKLEKEITQVVSNCRSLITDKNPFNDESSHKNNESSISTNRESKSSLTLEKVSSS